MKQILTTILLGFLAAAAGAQCDSTAYMARKYMSDNYISDGQSYRALLYDDQIAEFATTFYGGNEYRIAAFAGLEREQLLFSIYDEQSNLLFTNKDHKLAPYWNFRIENTITVRIEAMLNEVKQTSGCAVLLIGFGR